jgi:acyl carrier protein
MTPSIEGRVRRVVVEQLGVGSEELTPTVSLNDDLAADSLDLVEIVLRIEEEFGVQIPESLIDEIRTYGDLVDGVQTLDRLRLAAERSTDSASEPTVVLVRMIPLDHTRGEVCRIDRLTPYTAETITEETLRAGPGARLEVGVPPSVSDAELVRFGHQFARLVERHVGVTIRRDPRLAVTEHGWPLSAGG